MFAMRPAALTLLAAAAVTLSPGGPSARETQDPWLDVRPLPVLPPNSAQPQLAVMPDGVVLASWLEPVGERHRFRFASLPPGATAWGPPVTIHEGAGFFANWADVPSIAAAPDGMLAAHWLQTSGPEKYAYDVRIRTSVDGGRTWSEPFTPHRDGTPTEHGFASFVPWPGGGLAIAWLDGRKMAKGTDGASGHEPGEMTLRAAAIKHGSTGPEMLVDSRVCDCCPTTAVRTARGVLLAYRDRSPTEIRDIAITRYENGRWSEGRNVSKDGWQIAGCPVNGPSMSSSGSTVALAWFAAPSDAHVRVAFSTDGGDNFGTPIRVDDGQPLGRVDVELLPDGGAIVGWMERVENGAEFRVRRVSPAGERSASLTVARVAATRASGYPRIVRSGNRLVFAWVGEGQVNTAAADLPARTARRNPDALERR